ADVGPIASMPMVPQLTIRLDRSKVAHAGVSLQDINDLVEIAVGGKKTAAVYDGPTRIDVMVRADEMFRTSIESIRRLPVPLPNNKLTTLEDLASIQLVNGPLVINHESGYRRTGVKFNVAGRDLGSTMR